MQAASCSWPGPRYRTLHTPLKPQLSLSTRLFLSYCKSFCPGVHPVDLPYLVSTVVGSSCPFLLLTGAVWHGDSCISLPLPCGSCFPSTGVWLVSPHLAALLATVQAGWLMLQERLPWGPVASLPSYMRLHTAHDGQALQAAAASSSEYLSPTKNKQKTCSMNYRGKCGSSFCGGFWV